MASRYGSDWNIIIILQDKYIENIKQLSKAAGVIPRSLTNPLQKSSRRTAQAAKHFLLHPRPERHAKKIRRACVTCPRITDQSQRVDFASGQGQVPALLDAPASLDLRPAKASNSCANAMLYAQRSFNPISLLTSHKMRLHSFFYRKNR